MESISKRSPREHVRLAQASIAFSGAIKIRHEITYLKVDMLEPSHHHAVRTIFGLIEFGIFLHILNIEKSSQDIVVESLLIFQPFDVFSRVRIDMLQ